MRLSFSYKLLAPIFRWCTFAAGAKILIPFFLLFLSNAWGEPWDLKYSYDSTHANDGLENRQIHHAPVPKRIDLSHIEGKGVGDQYGFTQLKMILGPEYQKGHFLSLIELNGAVFDHWKFEANAGIIGRFMPKSWCEIFGLNVFYDFKEGRRGSYHQVGGGLEILNKRWELHINGFAPIGVKLHLIKKRVFDDYIGDFRAVARRFEFALHGGDGSIGYYMINGKNFQLYASAGGYFISGKFDTSSWGTKARLRPQYKDFLYLEFSVSHDRIFETIYQVNVIFSLPLYRFSNHLKHKKGPCGMANRQVYQPVDRNQGSIILARSCCCWDANF